MAKRKTFRNDKEGIAFLQMWREKGQADAISQRSETGNIPLSMIGRYQTWGRQAYADGFNAQVNTMHRERSSKIGMEVFGQ